MLTQDEFFQYLEDIYVQQAHYLESLKSYVRLSDDDPDVAVTGAASRTKSPWHRVVPVTSLPKRAPGAHPLPRREYIISPRSHRSPRLTCWRASRLPRPSPYR